MSLYTLSMELNIVLMMIHDVLWKTLREKEPSEYKIICVTVVNNDPK